MINSKSKTKKEVYFDQSVGLIQKIRVLHAIAESGVPVSVPKNEIWKLEPLRKNFGMAFSTVCQEGIKFSDIVSIDHSKPSTSMGKIERVLIFPHAITQHLKYKWKDKRKFKYSFAGLVTPERKTLIEDWITNVLKEDNYKLEDQFSLVKRLMRRLLLFLKLEESSHINKIGNFSILTSIRGRVFPTKTWDEDYFEFLSNSEFVLCPSGNYIWSYRFFESILCGAIPVIEEYCEAYEGFKFKFMKDTVDELVWNQADVEHNFKLCLERITIPKDDIVMEISTFN